MKPMKQLDLLHPKTALKVVAGFVHWTRLARREVLQNCKLLRFPFRSGYEQLHVQFVQISTRSKPRRRYNQIQTLTTYQNDGRSWSTPKRSFFHAFQRLTSV